MEHPYIIGYLFVYGLKKFQIGGLAVEDKGKYVPIVMCVVPFVGVGQMGSTSIPTKNT